MFSSLTARLNQLVGLCHHFMGDPASSVRFRQFLSGLKDTIALEWTLMPISVEFDPIGTNWTSFGQALRQMREARGWSLEYLSLTLRKAAADFKTGRGLSVPNLSKWEHDNIPEDLSLSEVMVIVDILRCKSDEEHKLISGFLSTILRDRGF